MNTRRRGGRVQEPFMQRDATVTFNGIPNLGSELSRKFSKHLNGDQLSYHNLSESPFSTRCLMRGNTISLKLKSLLASQEKEEFGLVDQ
ncbi:hypothetical protein N665_0567s0005 [Sinapis alba]|nr:hypothetical protein N665_0567s0005 [Sinapis alba]